MRPRAEFSHRRVTAYNRNAAPKWYDAAALLAPDLAWLAQPMERRTNNSSRRKTRREPQTWDAARYRPVRMSRSGQLPRARRQNQTHIVVVAQHSRMRRTPLAQSAQRPWLAGQGVFPARLSVTRRVHTASLPRAIATTPVRATSTSPISLISSTKRSILVEAPVTSKTKLEMVVSTTPARNTSARRNASIR